MKIFQKSIADNIETDENMLDGELEFDHSDSSESIGSGEFVNSIENLSIEDLQPDGSAVKKNSVPFFEYVRRFMFVFFLGMFIVSCIMLIQNLIDKHKADDIYSKLEEEFFSDGFSQSSLSAFKPQDGEVSYMSEADKSKGLSNMSDSVIQLDSGEDIVKREKYNEELEKVRARLTSLAQKNPDLYGWITIEGTNINYPLVQGRDNDYYLNHAYTGDFLPVGSIFVDYRCNTSITKNYNTVIYGHNITSGTMFHDITQFFKDEYFNGVNIVIYTMDGIYYYEPFSIYETRNDYQYFRTGFTSADDFIAFADEMSSNTQMPKDVSFTGNDRVLTLSTCTNGAYYARYALHAKLIKTVLE